MQSGGIATLNIKLFLNFPDEFFDCFLMSFCEISASKLAILFWVIVEIADNDILWLPYGDFSYYSNFKLFFGNKWIYLGLYV